MPFQRLKSGRFVLLGKRGVPYNIRVHYCSETTLAVWQFGPVLLEVIWMIKQFVESFRNGRLTVCLQAPWPNIKAQRQTPLLGEFESGGKRA